MHTHFISEDAYDTLTRAHNVVKTLYFMLDVYSHSDADGLIEASGLSAMAEHILNDLSKSLEGCEEIIRFSEIYIPPPTL